jgi:hypothetical protein
MFVITDFILFLFHICDGIDEEARFSMYKPYRPEFDAISVIQL